MTIDDIITILVLTPTMAVPVLLLIDLWRDRHRSNILFEPVAVTSSRAYNQFIESINR